MKFEKKKRKKGRKSWNPGWNLISGRIFVSLWRWQPFLLLRWHIFYERGCQDGTSFASLCLLLSREINVATPRAFAKKQNKKNTHTRTHKKNRPTTNMTRLRRERDGYGVSTLGTGHMYLLRALIGSFNYLHLGLVLVYDTWLFWTLSCLNVMAELASENCVKVNKRSWNPVGSFGNPPSMVCSMTLVPALFKKMFG